MAVDSSLGSQIVARELVIQKLLESAVLVGGIYTMGYDECLVLTNDLWKKQAGGIPQHCFLLATAMMPGETPDPEDEELILMRVVGPAALPAEAELVQVRAEAMREMVVARGAEIASSSPAVLDVLTRNEIQFSAVKAKILGTFYEVDVNGTPILAFGSDIETFYSSSRYKVYKPYGVGLSQIAGFPELTVQDEETRQKLGTRPSRVRIGTIRYTSTTRRRNGSNAYDTAVPVTINISDFIAMKTAVFGMTRLGKSNTMKTIATAICQFAAESNQAIGQLLFDPAGEYANVNVQDQTALSQIGTDSVTIFRYGADGTQPGIRPLSSNFFSDESIDVTWSIITAFLTPRNGSNYIQSFLSADVIGPEREEDDRSAYLRAHRRRSALFATLAKAGFRLPNSLRSAIVVNADVLTAVNQQLPQGTTQLQSHGRGTVNLDASNLVAFWDAFVAAQTANPAVVANWTDSQLDAILAVYRGSVGSGYRLLEPMRVYHSLARTDDYAQEILQELVDGKIVIVDMSLGTETVLKFCSERIVNHIVQDAARRFASGEDLNQIQIYIEEAHRLFNRDRMSAPEEADPYVRLAKEAAKFRIGLIYATQEVTSVDPIILSNTSNWVVTHLNNHSEVKELSKYYDFQDFSELTLKAEDVGFTRVKTRSGRYIVPTQIDLFDDSRVQAARQAVAAGRQASGD